MIDPVVLFFLLGLGVWSAIDGTAVAQIMISRPLVSGTLAGALLGDPATGLLVGGVLEVVHIGGVPAGGASLPEPGPAAIPAASAAILIGGPEGLAIGALAGVGLSLIGGWTVSLQRRVNGIWTADLEGQFVGDGGLSRLHWRCIGLDALRGFVLTGGGLAVVLLSPAAIVDHWALSWTPTLTLLLLPGALAAGALLRSWLGFGRRGMLLLLGILGGWALAVYL